MAEATINSDLSCRFCGYNLRGISRSGRCPECGQQVKEIFYLHVLDAEWLEWIRKDCNLLALAITCYLLGGFAFRFSERAGACFILVALCPQILASIGLGAPRARSSLKAKLSGYLVRLLGGALPILLILFIKPTRFNIPVLFFAWSISLAAPFAQLGYIARVLSNKLAAGQAMILGILLGTTIAVLPRMIIMFGRFDHPFIVIDITCMIIAALWGIVFLIAFANELRAKRVELLEILKNETSEDSAPAVNDIQPHGGG